MRILLFGQKIKTDDISIIQSLLHHLAGAKAEIYIKDSFLEQCLEMGIKPSKIETWNEYQDVVRLKPDCLGRRERASGLQRVRAVAGVRARVDR